MSNIIEIDPDYTLVVDLPLLYKYDNTFLGMLAKYGFVRRKKEKGLIFYSLSDLKIVSSLAVRRYCGAA
jgi:hypothetical protein